jgi:flagellar basal-body rod protein FlgG
MAAAAAIVNQKRLEVVANNLANINTTGFKREQVVFRIPEAPPEIQRRMQAAALNTTDPTAALWLNPRSETDFSQGNLRTTDNPFDLALTGKGFFAVQTTDGIRYTRNGRFTLDAAGQLVTGDGYTVLGQSGAISLDDGDFNVDASGRISVAGREVGRLRLVDFPENTKLTRVGQSLFQAPEGGGSETEAESVTVSQGCLERANVEGISSMTEMIEILRGYEAYQKAIRAMDESSAKAINDVGRVS